MFDVRKKRFWARGAITLCSARLISLEADVPETASFALSRVFEALSDVLATVFETTRDRL